MGYYGIAIGLANYQVEPSLTSFKYPSRQMTRETEEHVIGTIAQSIRVCFFSSGFGQGDCNNPMLRSICLSNSLG